MNKIIITFGFLILGTTFVFASGAGQDPSSDDYNPAKRAQAIVEYRPNLQKLYVAGCNISSIEPFEVMQHLKVFDVPWNPLSDLTYVSRVRHALSKCFGNRDLLPSVRVAQTLAARGCDVKIGCDFTCESEKKD